MPKSKEPIPLVVGDRRFSTRRIMPFRAADCVKLERRGMSRAEDGSGYHDKRGRRNSDCDIPELASAAVQAQIDDVNHSIVSMRDLTTHVECLERGALADKVTLTNRIEALEQGLRKLEEQSDMHEDRLNIWESRVSALEPDGA
jgi:hypothetical protein